MVWKQSLVRRHLLIGFFQFSFEHFFYASAVFLFPRRQPFLFPSSLVMA